MKNKLLIFISLFSAGALFGQTCPEIHFTYDAAGNRIKKEQINVNCAPVRKKQEQQVAAEIKVHPNPVQDRLVVELPVLENQAVNSIWLYDITGKEIYNNPQAVDKVEIDVSKLLPGTYFLKAIRGAEVKTCTVIKN